MNKDLLDQLPADEQPVASELTSAAEDMHLSQTFQWELETQLKDIAKKKSNPAETWRRIMAPVGWAVFTICAVFLISWTIRSLASTSPAATEGIPASTPPFESDVRQGRICGSSLALAHDFSVFLANPDKSGFVRLDKENTIAELRTFAWSPDGKQLAVAGNMPNNIYLTDSTGGQLQPLLPNPELGYTMGVAWSRNGKQLLTWSNDNNTSVYLVNAEGTNLSEKGLGMQFFETPQFAPDGKSILLYGADSSGAGLFQILLDGSQTRKISALSQDQHSYAWSPDGSHLAYIEADPELNESRLVVEEAGKGIVARVPVSKGTVPSSANLRWSPDGKRLVFELSSGPEEHALYLAQADGSGLVKVVDSARAPAISADGRCLAYIGDDQVFLIDLNRIASTPVLVSDLPTGQQRGTTDPELDDLQWSPSPASDSVIATEMSPSPEASFEADVRQGRICTGPLALAHDFSVFLTNDDKTGFIELDQEKAVDELRTFAWSPGGERLAILANQQGRGDVYIHDFDRQLEYILPNPDAGYLVDVVWSHDGRRLLLRSVKSMTAVYLVNADGSGSVEKRELGVQFFETPQFAPDDQSIVFHGLIPNGDLGPLAGLLRLPWNGPQPKVIGMGPPLQAEGSFAWSPDGSRLAYFEVLETEIQLVVEEVGSGNREIIANLPFDETLWTSGSINLSWSPDGKSLVFELADNALHHGIYLAHADGTRWHKVMDSASAPTISADGRCLAYIWNNQVFLMDLNDAASTSPMFLADLPSRRQPSLKPAKLQWQP